MHSDEKITETLQYDSYWPRKLLDEKFRYITSKKNWVFGTCKGLRGLSRKAREAYGAYSLRKILKYQNMGTLNSLSST